VNTLLSYVADVFGFDAAERALLAGGSLADAAAVAHEAAESDESDERVTIVPEAL
jgi:hypothetical protein